MQNEPPPSPSRDRKLRVRWIIFAFLFVFAFFAYVQRTSIAIAAERMMPELGLTQLQIGWLLTAFLIGYTVCQLPGGLLGERLGARLTFTVIGIAAAAATFATVLFPLILSGTVLLGALLASRALVGIAQAPVFPVSTGAIAAWFPKTQWALPQGLIVAGVGLGSAVTPPLIAVLMQAIGWKAALVLTTLPVIPLILWWFRYALDTPQGHPAVRLAELAELSMNPAPGRMAVSLDELLRVLWNRDILLLTFSYLSMNYVFYLLTFWSFLYLVQERHFTVLESGWLATIPFIGAAAGAAVGGAVSDGLCARWGDRWGYRLLPLSALPVGGLALAGAVCAASAVWAIVGLSTAFLAIELTEGAFFAAAMSVARQQSMTATGIVNTGGNCGGIIATPLVAALSGNHHWAAAFGTGIAFAIASGLLWFGIDATRTVDGNRCDDDRPGAACSNCNDEVLNKGAPITVPIRLGGQQ